MATVITQVHKRGTRVAGLLRYLFGPGRAEEHVNPRLVGAWDGSGELAELEPRITARGSRDFRRLVGLLEQPVLAADHAPTKYVWHASMRLAPEDRDREFSDARWSHMARELLAEAGIARHGDDDGLRWVVVRHNDDHVHIVATLVREDGRIDWMKNDWPRTREASARISRRFGLRRDVPTADRTAAKRPGQHEFHKARRLGQPHTGRDVLRGRVRAAVAAATSEDEFFDRLRVTGVMVKLRESIQRPGEITGYAVAIPPDVAGQQPIYFAGGKLAPDLTLPKLRHRWGTPTPVGHDSRVRVSREERIRVMNQASVTAWAAADEMRRTGRSDPASAQAAAEAAADILRAAATAMEGKRGGPLTDAAETFDRAARAGIGPATRHTPSTYRMRSLSRLISLMGRVSGNDDALAALHLVATLAALADTLGRLRAMQDRLHQAQAARDAATALRVAAINARRLVTPPATPAQKLAGDGRSASGYRPLHARRAGGRR